MCDIPKKQSFLDQKLKLFGFCTRIKELKALAPKDSREFFGIFWIFFVVTVFIFSLAELVLKND